MNNIGIILTQIGTPEACNLTAVRSYLRRFLSDKRVVEASPLFWQPILHGLILRTRPRQSLKLYKKIWTEAGSPLLVYSKSIASKLQKRLQHPVQLGMHYSNPSIPDALNQLQAKNSDKIILLPLFPQYSATTTASALDKTLAVFKQWRNLPGFQLIRDYADHPHYIQCISEQIVKHWQTRRAEHLLFSFHSIPKRYATLGDPYPTHCLQTAKRIAEHLQLTPDQWSVGFQSRIGKLEWIAPYTDKLLKYLPQKGITDLQVVCPGFSVDCLETLEEIALRGKEQFLAAGGKQFDYIPALNDSDAHIDMLAEIVMPHLQG